ncbi:MAG: thioredoxin family protein [Chloroflexi bacterium]|nr:thioredoxin family protein [Chloroflexota bacterium]
MQNKYHARSVPTVVSFVNGREADRFVGARNQNAVQQFLAQLPAPD